MILDEHYYIIIDMKRFKKLNLEFAKFLPTKKDKIKWFINDCINYIVPFNVRLFYYNHIKTIWAPKHKRIRKAVPRYWMDLDYVLLQVNFEIIKSFYEDEFLLDNIDWEADNKHKEFAEWLIATYHYITVTRPELEAEKEASYPDSDDYNRNITSKKLYKELYGDVDRIENYIHKRDTKALTELVKYRDFLWT